MKSTSSRYETVAKASVLSVHVTLGRAEGVLPDFWDYAPRIPHGLGARAMAVLCVLHIGAALYHHFILKDGLICRMWFGGTT